MGQGHCLLHLCTLNVETQELDTTGASGWRGTEHHPRNLFNKKAGRQETPSEVWIPGPDS